MKKLAYIFIILFSVIVLSCNKSTESEDDNVDRAAILDNLGNIILENYSQLKIDADSLNIYADSFQTNTTEQDLLKLRSAFVKTYKTFQTVQFLNFGKAEELNIVDAFNLYPEDTTIILNAIQSNSYSIQTISNKAKGLQALDYLLYAVRDYSTTDLVNWYNNTPNAKLYLKSITTEIKRISDLIYNDWNNQYLTTFKESQGIDQSSSFFLMTNALVSNFEAKGRSAKVGIPLGYVGTSEGTTLQLELIEARHSNLSIELMKVYVDAIEKILNGKNGLGYDDYLNTIGAEYNGTPLSNIINTQMATLKTKINVLEEPYADEIVNDRQKVKEVFQAFQQLVITFKVDVASAMSIDLIYQDTDGD